MNIKKLHGEQGGQMRNRVDKLCPTYPFIIRLAHGDLSFFKCLLTIFSRLQISIKAQQRGHVLLYHINKLF